MRNHSHNPPQRTLLWIVGLLTLPLMLAIFLHLSGWRPAQTANHGQLLMPPTLLALPGARATGQWSLVLLHDAPCGVACARRLEELQRLRVALGRNMEQTRLIWLGKEITDEAAAIRQQIPTLAAVDDTSTTLSTLPPGSLLLVDPQGLAMLRYPPDAAASDIRSDLERLLKAGRQP